MQTQRLVLVRTAEKDHSMEVQAVAAQGPVMSEVPQYAGASQVQLDMPATTVIVTLEITCCMTVITRDITTAVVGVAALRGSGSGLQGPTLELLLSTVPTAVQAAALGRVQGN
jgi:hypothetical protein